MRAQPIQSFECLVLQRNHPAAFLLTLRMRSARFRSKKRKGVSLGPTQHAGRSVDPGDGRVHGTNWPHVGSGDRSTSAGCADRPRRKLAVDHQATRWLRGAFRIEGSPFHCPKTNGTRCVGRSPRHVPSTTAPSLLAWRWVRSCRPVASADSTSASRAARRAAAESESLSVE